MYDACSQDSLSSVHRGAADLAPLSFKAATDPRSLRSVVFFKYCGSVRIGDGDKEETITRRPAPNSQYLDATYPTRCVCT